MAVKLGELLTGLGRCLDSLGGDQLTPPNPTDGCNDIERITACCVLLKQAADHASTSDFIRQDVVKLLHHRLEHSSSLADSLLGQHVGAFLLQPQALQLLLSSLPAVASKQRMLYQSLCDQLQPGLETPRWSNDSIKAESLRVVRERAMWELSKLVTAAPGCSEGSVVVLASHLPWLLHLLLLTDVGCMPDEEVSDRSPGGRNEASENLSATTVQHIASSGSRDGAEQSQWGRPRSADSHSLKQEGLSISLASTHASDPDKVQGELPERPSTKQHSDSDKTLVAATGAVTKQLCSGPRLCSWLGLKADTIEGPQVGQMCAEQPLDMAQSARLAAEVAEVCIEAVMQPTQVAYSVSQVVLPGVQKPLEPESLGMELAAAHMTLLRIAEEAPEQQHRQTGPSGSSRRQHVAADRGEPLSRGHLQCRTLLRMAAHTQAAMAKCGAMSGLSRTPRTSRGCAGGKAKGLPVEVAAHVLKLLGQSLPAAARKEAGAGPAADLLTGALRHAMDLHQLSLAGPSPDVDYGVASSACEEASRAFQRSRLADFELAAPSSPSAQGLRSASKGSPRRHASSEGLRAEPHTAKKRKMNPQPISPRPLPQPEVLPGSAGAAEPVTPGGHQWPSGPGMHVAQPPGATESETAAEDSASDQESPLLQRGQFTEAQAERWWEHYIGVKLDLVQNVLQDEVADDANAGAATPQPGSAPGVSPTTNQAGSSAGDSSSQQHRTKPNMMRDTGFREVLWQRLHIASLTLARQALLAAMTQRGGSSSAGAAPNAPPDPDSSDYIDLTCESRDSSGRTPEELTQVWSELMPQEEVLSGIRNACLLVDPSCGTANYCAAIAGAKAAPMEAIPVLLAVRMGRYLSGPGRMPVQDLVPAYLEVLEELSSFAVGVEETQSRRAGQGRDRSRSTCPRQVLSQVLLAFLDAGDLDLGRLPHDANSAGRLIRLILQGMPAHEALCMASSGAIGLCQGMLGLPSKEPAWSSSLAAVLHSICFDAAEDADVATCVAVLHQLLLRMQQGQRHIGHGGPCLDNAEGFQIAADAVIAACRGVVCWGGLEVHGLEETLGLLLDMAVAVHSRCALSTAALLDMLDKGREAGAEVKEECEIAAFGPWLAESVKCFHEWVDSQMSQLLRTKVKSLEDALVAELCPSEGGGQVISRTGLLLRRLDACTLAEEECTSANPLQKQIQEWYVQGFGQLQSGTTGAIALADEADAMEAAHDEAAETSHDSHRKQHKVKKSKKATRSSNPYVLAAMAELASHGGGSIKRESLPRDGQGTAAGVGDEGADDLSSDDDDESGNDLDDFIVCKPGRNYQSLFAQQFKYSCTEPKAFLRRCL